MLNRCKVKLFLTIYASYDKWFSNNEITSKIDVNTYLIINWFFSLLSSLNKLFFSKK